MYFIFLKCAQISNFDTKSRVFLWLFSQNFGLAYSPLSSAKLSCSSEVTLNNIEGPYRERDQSTTESFTLQTFSHRSNAKANIILGTYQSGLIKDNLQILYVGMPIPRRFPFLGESGNGNVSFLGDWGNKNLFPGFRVGVRGKFGEYFVSNLKLI